MKSLSEMLRGMGILPTRRNIETCASCPCHGFLLRAAFAILFLTLSANRGVVIGAIGILATQVGPCFASNTAVWVVGLLAASRDPASGPSAAGLVLPLAVASSFTSSFSSASSSASTAPGSRLPAPGSRLPAPGSSSSSSSGSGGGGSSGSGSGGGGGW